MCRSVTVLKSNRIKLAEGGENHFYDEDGKIMNKGKNTLFVLRRQNTDEVSLGFCFKNFFLKRKAIVGRKSKVKSALIRQPLQNSDFR